MVLAEGAAERLAAAPHGRWVELLTGKPVVGSVTVPEGGVAVVREQVAESSGE
jgi:hypothetical protein